MKGSPLSEVRVSPLDLDQLRPILGEARFAHFLEVAEAARALLEGRVVWNLNSTATGGGVAEMLQVLLAYARGAGIDTRWLVIAGEPEFFAVTKRIHNWIHGNRSGGELGDRERRIYEDVCAANADRLRSFLRPDDVVLLHDPQTAGIAPHLTDRDVRVVWRSHIGLDHPDSASEEAWEFLRPYLAQPDRCVFSRPEYAPGWMEGDRVSVIPPSIDPLSPKNHDLDASTVAAILVQAGIAADSESRAPVYTRRDGTVGTVRRTADVVRENGPPGLAVPLVVQISRWDRLKDMVGVMRGMVDHVVSDPAVDAHLVLAGPSVTGVVDDPEGAEVFEECVGVWESLEPGQRQRVHLVSLPMDDSEENAVMVNALQRHATIVVQKSVAEGFGLTVSEAMWKSRPVVASAVGGIVDQVVDGETGVLLEDPRDLEAFGTAVRDLLVDEKRRAAHGEAGRARVRDRYLPDRHLLQYAELLQSLG